MQLNWKIYIVNPEKLKRAARNITNGNDLWRDLFQELIIILYSQDEEKIQDMYDRNELDFYCIRIMINEYRSTRREFFKKYRHLNDETVELSKIDRMRLGNYCVQDIDNEILVGKYHDADDKVQALTNYRESLRPIERILHDMYHKMPKKSYRKLGKQVGIPYRSVGLHIKNANDKIKIICAS